METVSTLEVVFFLLFLLLSAFFSSAETAFTAMNRVKLRSLEERNVRGAKTLIRLMEDPKMLIMGMLIGNNIANVAASALATAVLLGIFQQFSGLNFATEMALVTASMTILLLIFGEITPKTIAIKDPVNYGLAIRKPIVAFVFLFKPLIFVFSVITAAISKLFRLSSSPSGVYSLYSEEDLKTLANIGEEEGAIEKEEREMIHSVIDFSKTVVREIMTPRTDAVCIEVGSMVSDAVAVINEHGHSRIPVYESKIDNVMGVVYAKDLLSVEDKENTSIRKFMRSLVFIPETKSIETLLHQMQRSRFHMAIVLDEYGGMSGLVTLEDIIEEIIGEIQDEYDQDENPELTSLGDNHYLVDAGMSISDFAEDIGVSIPTEEVDYDTVGGLILNLLDRLPVRGERIHYESLELVVRDVKKRRIQSVEVLVKKTVADHPFSD